MHTVFGDHHYGIILKKRTTNGVRKQTAAAVVAGFGAGSDGLLTGEALVEEEEAEASEVEDGSNKVCTLLSREWGCVISG